MFHSATDHRRRGPVRLARLALVGALSVSALAAVPAAQADSLSSARAHIRSADAALHQVVAGATTGSVSVDLAALQAQLSAAGVDTAKLVKHAHTDVVRVHAAAALTKLAAQEARDAAQLTPIVGDLTGVGQAELASFVASVTQGREQALSLVVPMVGKLPTDVRSQVAGVVAQLSGAGTGQVGQLAGSISPGSIACPAIDAVSQVVATVLAAVPTDLTRLTSIAAFLPADAASQLTSLVNGLPDQLNSLLASLKAGFSCSSTTPIAGLTGLTGITGGDPTAIIGQVLNAVTGLVQSILGSLPGLGSGGGVGGIGTILGGSGSGSGSGSGGVGGVTSPVSGLLAPVSGLLGQVTSLIPGLGGLLGGSGSGGLFGGIL